MTAPHLHVVCCVSDWAVFGARLAASPCLAAGAWPLTVAWNAGCAADAFNAAADGLPTGSWLMWVHQDVHLPTGFDAHWMRALGDAQCRWPNLAVAGVYGLATREHGADGLARRAGRLLDRGRALEEPATLPCTAESLDELLVAVKVGSGLRMDAELAWDFYATDLVLQARQKGLEAAVLDAWCEHWSNLPSSGALARPLRERVMRSGAVFESKWRSQLPLTTPCFQINREGDVARFIEAHSHNA